MTCLNDILLQRMFYLLSTISNGLFRSNQDSLAQATVHTDNDDSGPPPGADENIVINDDKNEDSLIHDMKNIRKRAEKQITAREKERAAAAAEKPQVQIRDNKKRKNKK